MEHTLGSTAKPQAVAWDLFVHAPPLKRGVDGDRLTAVAKAPTSSTFVK